MQKSKGSVAPVKAAPSSGPPIPARTLRIPNIPPSVTEQDFRKYLGGILGYPDFMLSYVPDETNITATITPTKGEPASLARCIPGKEIDLPYPGTKHGLLVDCDFFGLTPLYTAKEPTVDIVVVTGLAGNAYGSWGSRSPPQMWVRDFLPSDLRERGCQVRILTFGYDTAFRDKTITPTVQIFGRWLMESLSRLRPEGNASSRRPIIFMGHSLGGLVIKHALADASRPESLKSEKAILSSSVGLFFFGVPNQGLDVQNFRTLVEDQKNARFIESLATGSESLRVIHDSFVRGVNVELKGCQIFSFYEKKDTQAVVIKPDGTWSRTGNMIRLVTPESATVAFPSAQMQPQIGIDADHSNMVKFAGKNDPSYQIVLAKTVDCVKNAQKIVDARKRHA
ncbi:hypothetical protein BZA05DRAFT_408884 [Tricharina praecox]|uniref:uncharacterized protein n=1 Tax=Tricharina praecox TaxID=43433 RepID=UPI0022210477|nr:uncharacterized protein BZA05DRAFT_408884 [Tricharina praecox]KAI5844898.1 hypothetical protein BZA05DRAFT_408884 [Tricharina praecox]